MDDIILNKAAIIERCLKRIDEEYIGFENEIFTNLTRQDSILLNLERAIQAAIDAGTRIIKIRKLGIPQSTREIFQILVEEGFIDQQLADKLKKMVGFRNIAVHEYQKLNLEIVKRIVEVDIKDLIRYKETILKSDF